MGMEFCEPSELLYILMRMLYLRYHWVKSLIIIAIDVYKKHHLYLYSARRWY